MNLPPKAKSRIENLAKNVVDKYHLDYCPACSADLPPEHYLYNRKLCANKKCGKIMINRHQSAQYCSKECYQNFRKGR